jgi:phenylacetate-CoA ligase
MKAVSQNPPLPIVVEVAAGSPANNAELKSAIEAQIKERLLVSSRVTLVENNTLPRETYKSKLVDYSEAVG